MTLPPPTSELANETSARFRVLYDAHYDDLWRYCRRRTRTNDDAADVMAEVMTVAWRRLDVVPDPPATRPWLFGVARNQLRSARRNDQRQQAIADRVGNQGAFATETEAPSLAPVAAALEQLKPADRELLLLVAWDELPHAEIGQLLGISPNAVAIRIHRARQALNDLMEKNND